MVSISGNADGQESTNTMKYTADLLTKVSNGDTSYNYEYDGWGRTTKVKIANETYAQTEYLDEQNTKTVFASGDVAETKIDKYDRITEQVTKFADGIVETVTRNYDSLPNKETTTIDISDGTKYNIVKTNEKGKVISEVRSGEYPLEKIYGYNDDGDLQETVYKVVKDAAATTDEEKYEALTYGYETDHTPDKRNSKVQLPFNVEQNFAYDGLGRTKEISLTDNLVKDIYYAKYGDHATNRVNSVWYGINGIRKDNVKYTYDKAGNIATVTENGVVTRYVYDGLNRLIREDNPTFGKVTYEYDNAGNILCKTVKGKKYRYTYPQDGWKDQLLERRYKDYDGTEVIERFQYDSLGNPTTYRNKSLTWQGRRLKQLDDTTFTYDVNGIRTSKVHNSVLTKYIYDGNNLIAEQRGNNWIYYIYGVDGVAGFNYQDKTYLYRKNVQGDVTHIYRREEGRPLTLVAEYVYDAWGNWEIVLNNADDIANLNPFRYRSYYFDVETGLYYLQTRYYDPELGRFISADSIEYLDPETLGGLNLYAYCGNNPVMAVDPEGTELKWWHKLLIGIIIIAVLAIATVLTAGIAGVGIGAAFSAGFAGVAIGAGASGFAVTVAAGAFAGAAIGATIGLGMGALVGGLTTGTWQGVLDGAANGFMMGAITGAISGGIRSGINFAQTTPLIRTISNNELSNIKSTGQFSSANGSMESKWFATNKADAHSWAMKFNQSKFVGIRVSKAALKNSAVYYQAMLDSIGPAYCIDIEYLNTIISSIWFF